MEENLTAKVIIVGDASVGKTCLLQRMINNTFDFETKTTTGFSNSSIEVEYNDQKLELKLWDTAGQERYNSLTAMYFKGVDFALLVYDITNKSSFEKLSFWDQHLKDNSIEGNRVFVIGSKSDLEEKRAVSIEEGESYAKSHGANFLEVSSLNNVNIDALKYMIASIYFSIGMNSKSHTQSVNIGTKSNTKTCNC